ncbi:MAG: hypothetical protein WAX67_01215 [Rugosibacter sp.]
MSNVLEYPGSSKWIKSVAQNQAAYPLNSTTPYNSFDLIEDYQNLHCTIASPLRHFQFYLAAVSPAPTFNVYRMPEA